MKPNPTTGWWLLLSVFLILIPYTILTITFDYPDVLRNAPGNILTAFSAGGPSLILTWLAFGLGGLPLIYVYHQTDHLIGPKHRFVTSIGVFGLYLQLIGLLRWVFVVPILADQYSQTTDPIIQQSIYAIFMMQHQFGGVLLGEFLGQLMTIIWTIATFHQLFRAGHINTWHRNIAIIASLIYALGQAELLHTVIPNMLYWEPAAFIGSTLWLVVLGWLGVIWIRQKMTPTVATHALKPTLSVR